MIRRCKIAPVGAAASAAGAMQALVPSLNTERLRLRAPGHDDLQAWNRLMVPDADGDLGGPHTEEEGWEAFCVYVAGWLLQGHGLWAVDRLSDGVHLGFVHLGLEWEDLEPELGWMFLPEHRGQGYATEAAKAAHAHALGLFGDGGFVSYIAATNTASRRVAERLGANRDTKMENIVGDDTFVYRHGNKESAHG